MSGLAFMTLVGAVIIPAGTSRQLGVVDVSPFLEHNSRTDEHLTSDCYGGKTLVKRLENLLDRF